MEPKNALRKKDTTKMLYPFFAKEYQVIPKTKTKNVDLTTFYQGMQKNAKE